VVSMGWRSPLPGAYLRPVRRNRYFKGIDFRIALPALSALASSFGRSCHVRTALEAPGPELVPAHHPELFQVLNSVREQLGRIHQGTFILIPDVNAGSPSGGGFMGVSPDISQPERSSTDPRLAGDADGEQLAWGKIRRAENAPILTSWGTESKPVVKDRWPGAGRNLQVRSCWRT